jgi:hypothetical protein
VSRSSSRGSQHIQPGRPTPQHVTTTAEPAESAAVAADAEERYSAFQNKGLWISILIWLTIYLGLSLTIWLDLIIGLFHTPGK